MKDHIKPFGNYIKESRMRMGADNSNSASPQIGDGVWAVVKHNMQFE